jgi:hypothetical protein
MVGRMVFRSLVERVMPNRLASERDSLTQQLDFHRRVLLRKLDGLDDEPLRWPMTASGVSLLGLVKHRRLMPRQAAVPGRIGSAQPRGSRAGQGDAQGELLPAPTCRTLRRGLSRPYQGWEDETAAKDIFLGYHDRLGIFYGHAALAGHAVIKAFWY